MELAGLVSRKRRSVVRPGIMIIIICDGDFLVLSSRKDDTNDRQKDYYSSLRAAFRTLRGLVGWEDGQENSNEVLAAIEREQFLVGEFFDFEATIQLGLWNELLEICRDPERFPKARFYPQMLDLALQIGTPAAVQVAVMKVNPPRTQLHPWIMKANSCD